MNETIKIGFIGAGGNTELRHVPGFKAQDKVILSGVANRSYESSKKAAEKLGIENPYENWLDLVEDDNIDAVCIGTWPYMHSTATIAALENGKHVLCEARMAMNSVEGHAMLQASLENPDLITQVVPPPHTMKIEQHVIDLISEGFIGDLISVNARIFQGSNFPDPNTPVHWRHQRELSGNNVMTMGIWYENLMRWVGVASSVVAVGQTVVKHRRDHTGRRVEMTIPDQVDIIYDLWGGGTVNLSMSTVVGTFAPELDIWLFGTTGTLRIHSDEFTNPGSPSLVLTGAKSNEESLSVIEIPIEKQSDWRVEEEFINAIRGVEPVTRTNFTDAVKYMEFTDAVLDSMQSGKVVQLPFA